MGGSETYLTLKVKAVVTKASLSPPRGRNKVNRHQVKTQLSDISLGQSQTTKGEAGLFTKPAAQGRLFPQELVRRHQTPDKGLPQTSGENWVQACVLLVTGLSSHDFFFSVILFNMKDLFYLLRLLFFCNCLNKNWKCSHFDCPHAQKPAALLLLLISTLLTLGIIQNLLKWYCILRAVNCYYFYCRFFPYALSHVYEKDAVYHIDHSHKTTFS